MPIIHDFLERITYHNEENDFVVTKLQEKGKRELTTIVGNLTAINPGESLKLMDKWVHNKKSGEQFQVESYKLLSLPLIFLSFKITSPNSDCIFSSTRV